MRIDRWNGNRLRRYHLKSGAIIVTHSHPRRDASVIPAWCGHISTGVNRSLAAAKIWAERAAA